MKKIQLHTIIVALLILYGTSNAQVQRDWVAKFMGQGTDNAGGIAADNSGNVWICGNTDGISASANIYTIKYNSAGTQVAAAIYNSPYNNADRARGIAIDPAGNVYVVGRINIVNAIGSSADVVVIKYNSSAVQQWSTIFNAAQNWIDDANAIAVDAAGNVYITGSVVKDNPFEYDYLTAKFNSSGVLQWSATYNGTRNAVDIASDIAVDASGNVYVTGLSHGQIGNLAVINTYYDYATVKYSSAGVQQWVRRYNGAHLNDEAKSLALDGSGNVYVTGSSSNASGNLDCVTIKYSTAGVLQWLQRFAGSAALNDAGNSIAVDGSGNAVITGHTYVSSLGIDALTIKYNSSGAQQWLATHDTGSGAREIAKVVGLDVYGNVYVAAEINLVNPATYDFLTIKYTSAGALAWATRYNGPENQNDIPFGMAVANPPSFPPIASNARIYVMGTSANDVITIKYSQPIVINPSARPGVTTEELTTKGKLSISHQPNPVKSFVNFQFDLPVDSRVTIDIYDAVGRKVYTLVDGFRKAGTHTSRFSTVNLAGGLYYYKFYGRSAGNEFRQTKTIVIQR